MVPNAPLLRRPSRTRKHTHPTTGTSVPSGSNTAHKPSSGENDDSDSSYSDSDVSDTPVWHVLEAVNKTGDQIKQSLLTDELLADDLPPLHPPRRYDWHDDCMPPLTADASAEPNTG